MKLLFDILKFGNDGLQILNKFKNFKNIKDDFSNFKKYKKIYNEADFVIHLASVSGMPSCKKFKKESNRINYLSTKKFYFFLKDLNNLKKLYLLQALVFLAIRSQ